MDKIRIESGVIFFTDPSGQYILRNKVHSSNLIESVLPYDEYEELYEEKGIEYIDFPQEALKHFRKQNSTHLIIDPNNLDYGVAVKVPNGTYSVEGDGFHYVDYDIVISNEEPTDVYYQCFGFVSVDGSSLSILDGKYLSEEYLLDYRFKNDINFNTGGDTTYRIVGVYNDKKGLIRIRLEEHFYHLYRPHLEECLSERIAIKHLSPYQLLDNFSFWRKLYHEPTRALRAPITDQNMLQYHNLLEMFNISHYKQLKHIRSKMTQMLDGEVHHTNGFDAFNEWLSVNNYE